MSPATSQPRPSGRATSAGAAAIALAVLLLLAAAPSAAAGEPLAADQVQVAFVFNFAKFTEWPASAFAGPDAPLVVGIVGGDPFGGLLEQTLTGRRVDGHPLRFERYSVPAEIGRCHILVVNGSLGKHLTEVFAQIGERSVLTVAAAPGFIEQGGVIELVVEDSRVRFRIHLDHASRAGITLSSRLLALATVVRGDKSTRGN